MDESHALIEMLLSSLFVDEYIDHEQVLIASNDTVEYRYVKGRDGFDMSVKLVSLEEMTLPLKVRFEGEPFKINLTSLIGFRSVLDTSSLA
jgi:hypothetical protein